MTTPVQQLQDLVKQHVLYGDQPDLILVPHDFFHLLQRHLSDQGIGHYDLTRVCGVPLIATKFVSAPRPVRYCLSKDEALANVPRIDNEEAAVALRRAALQVPGVVKAEAHTHPHQPDRITVEATVHTDQQVRP